MLRRPKARCLRNWWWGGDGAGDHSLYDKDGLTIARLVLEGAGRYHLRTPLTRPRMAWPSLDTKRYAESMALAAIPLASVDPKLAARIAKDNSTPNPMGRRSTGSRPIPAIPSYLAQTRASPQLRLLAILDLSRLSSRVRSHLSKTAPAVASRSSL
jgi:hypothetical protein